MHLLPKLRRVSKKQAFSLVELSIVLVILGLLVGGVLSGQSLIRAASLRSVGTDIMRFQASIASFRDKHFMLPGDMTNATSFWGKDNAACPADTGTASTSGTCNGNGDGILKYGDVLAPAGATAEIFQFWRQLASAGLIEGSYSGLSNPAGSTGQRTALPGWNVPTSRLGQNSGYSIENHGNVTTTGGAQWIGSYNNDYVFGASSGVYAACCPPEVAILKPEEAWNIDTKLDDGKPAQGFVRTYYRYSKETAVGHTTYCTTTNVEATTEYNLANPDPMCNLDIISKF